MKISFNPAEDYLFHRKSNYLPIAVVTLSIAAVALTGIPEISDALGLTWGMGKITWIGSMFRTTLLVFLIFSFIHAIVYGFAVFVPIMDKTEPLLFDGIYANVNKSTLGMDLLGLLYVILLFRGNEGISAFVLMCCHLFIASCIRIIKYRKNKQMQDRLRKE